MTEKTTVAIFGAAGSMGTRSSNALKNDSIYHVLYVEAGEKAMARLRERGVEPTEQSVALKQAEVIVLAVPDALIATVAAEIVPEMQSGAMLIGLDPAAPHAGRLPGRQDVSYFFSHPSHPPIFNDETEAEARRDFFGGVAKQSIVSALLQGPEEDYTKGEAIASKLFGPILRSHRISIEQMAILEPALSETVTATCLTVIREALDEAVKRGVPAEAARDFLLGHLNVELAILFDEIDWELSDGAKEAVADAMPVIFQPDWKKVFDAEQLLASTRKITQIK
ncbi:MAG TPA: semialdehyde dehydrogenase [Candidatus Handelsmanbacteria bacterium]|nr:semialdehyde dehydrogenase [Candidatus Handelsmanbacteria bacterium]